jgi:hypothetical protein
MPLCARGKPFTGVGLGPLEPVDQWDNWSPLITAVRLNIGMTPMIPATLATLLCDPEQSFKGGSIDFMGRQDCIFLSLWVC